MSLLDPIVPYLGPLGPALAVSGTLVVILGLIGIVSFMLYKVKRDIFETSVGWVGATVVLSLITILFRGMTYLCGCAWYYDTGGNPTALVPLTYMLITGSFFAIIYNFYILPSMKVGSRRQRLDTYLPFTSSYMTVLASAGVTHERMLRSTAEKDPKFMLSDEIANVVGRIDLLGYDVLNAINAEVDRSPSTNYQDLLRGFGGVIRTGGDMKKFFQGITDHLFQKRSLQVQAFLDSLGIIAETYVLMLIAFPLMLVVMLSIMASIGGSLGGIDVFSFMYLMAFILIPICGVMFLFILDTMQPKG